MNIEATFKRKHNEYGLYFVPMLIVTDGDYQQAYESPVDYMHGYDANAHARKWKAESLEVGYITYN